MILQLGGWDEEQTTPHHKISLLRNVTQGLGFGRVTWNDVGNRKWMHLAQDSGHLRTSVKSVTKHRVI